MAGAAADIIVEVGGDVTPLERALRQGGRNLDSFSRRGVRLGQNMAKAGKVIAAGLLVGATAATAMASKAADAGAEIANLSRAAGAAPTEFQKWAVGARSVGIEQDKLSGILRDTRERIGEFMATGAGPMADFFENVAPKVGVTADQFARLSGPDALQLYVSSLEQANLSSAQMIFYLESMAGDASDLMPLLQNNGQQMKAFGDEAARTGRILSDDTIAGAQQLKGKLSALKGTISTDLTTALIGLEDEILILAQFVTDYGIPALEGLIRLAASAAEGFRDLSTAMALVSGNGAEVVGGDVAARIGGQLGVDPAAEVTVDPTANTSGTGNAAADQALLDLYGGDGAGDAPGVKPENLLPPPPPAPLALPPITVPGPSSASGGDVGARDGGAGEAFSTDGPTQEDLDALAESLASENELLERDYAAKLEALEDFKANEIGTKEEWNDLETRIEQDHADKLAKLEAQKRAAKMQAIGGMFGDLSALMQSENKKLFQIGKGAAIAETAISGYEAAGHAWKTGMRIGGPPIAATFLGASLLKTATLISGINATSANGGGGGASSAGGGSAAAPAAPSAPAPAAQQVNLSIGGGEWFPRSAVLALGEEMQELSRQGAIFTVS